MKRLTKIILKNILKVPYFFGMLYYYDAHKTDENIEKRYALLRRIVKHATKSGQIEIAVYGRENIPTDQSFIFYPNHQGIFDGFAMLEACPLIFSPVIKQELMHYPVVKQIFSNMLSMPMDRSDLKQSMKVMVEVAKRVKNGDNCLIFPEGTRSKNGNQLGEFKGGSFKPALKAKCPIVPVALIDSYKPFDQEQKGPITVQVHILNPIPYEAYGTMKTGEIADMVKKMIEETISANSNE